MNLDYRLARADDSDALIAAGKSIFDNPVDPSMLQEFLNDKRHHLFISAEGDKIVGFASGFHYVHPDKLPQLFINEVSVEESFRNQGIGAELVKRLCEYAAEHFQCGEAWIGTEVSNAAARKCYVKAGGEEDKEPFVLIEFTLNDGNDQP